MKARHFLKEVDDDQVVVALGRAELPTHARVHVFVSHRKHKDVLRAAQAEFQRLGMDTLPGSDGVLIYLAPRQKGFAVLGGQAIHERCGDAFWQQVTQEMTGHFRKGAYTAGLVHGIARAGAMLAEHFPRVASAGGTAAEPTSGAGADTVEHD
jgi:uncharacterized membrane protein